MAKKRPKLDPSVLEPSLFPKNVWDEYFNAEGTVARFSTLYSTETFLISSVSETRQGHRQETENQSRCATGHGGKGGRRRGRGEEARGLSFLVAAFLWLRCPVQSEGEEGPIGDYDEDEEEFGDDDYVNNYFDNGEGDGDDAFDVGGDDEGGTYPPPPFPFVALEWLTGRARR